MKTARTNKLVELDLVSFHQFMFDNLVPIGDIFDFEGEPIIKTIPSWRKNELLPFIRPGLHFKISFAELIWIRILDTLRELSYPVAQTRKITEYFFKDAYESNLPKQNYESHKKALTIKKNAGTITPDEELTLQHIEESLADDVLLYLLKYDINYLTNLTIDWIKSREERTILIFADGKVGEIYRNEDPYNHRDEKLDVMAPHIRLSLSYYLQEFLSSEELSKIFIPQILNDKEKTVIKEMKNRNLKEITIKMDNGKPQRIETKDDGILSGEQAKKIMEILGLKNYQEIRIHTRDKSTLVFEKTIKNK